LTRIEYIAIFQEEISIGDVLAYTPFIIRQVTEVPAFCPVLCLFMLNVKLTFVVGFKILTQAS
jgi:hypothetical protein